ncbi:MAG: hypothetical protein PF541_18570 [Prolixibacteraceae bacterium]|jgi:hypothetical protein|nr:hypothetical protein [Prolixibacteraceae bacterium]
MFRKSYDRIKKARYIAALGFVLTGLILVLVSNYQNVRKIYASSVLINTELPDAPNTTMGQSYGSFPGCDSCSISSSCSQLYRLSTQRLNIDMKPKEVFIEAVNKFLKEKLKEKGFVFSYSQLKLTKKLKDGLIGVIGFRAMSYSYIRKKI